VALAREKRHTHRRFQLFDARRDVRRDAVELARGPHDAAFACNGAKDDEVGKLHVQILS
jgi:hypothetical protein